MRTTIAAILALSYAASRDNARPAITARGGTLGRDTSNHMPVAGERYDLVAPARLVNDTE